MLLVRGATHDWPAVHSPQLFWPCCVSNTLNAACASQQNSHPMSDSASESSFRSACRVGSTVCGWPELQVVALLWAARPVVELGPLVAAADDWNGSVVGVHD